MSATYFTDTDGAQKPAQNIRLVNGQWHVARFTGGPIATLGSITGGSAYTNGAYTNVPLTGGLGTAATANITVAGGAVTVVTIVSAGPTVAAGGAAGYQVGDALSAAAANIGGTGSGFSVPVATITTWSYTPQSSFIMATLVAGGGQGGGGHSTGGGGGGGGSGFTILDQMVAVTAGSALTLHVAAVVNAGGGIAGAGTDGNFTSITGSVFNLPVAKGGVGGGAGAATNGGLGGGSSAFLGSALGPIAGGAAGAPGAGGNGGAVGTGNNGGGFIFGSSGAGGAGTSAGGGGIGRSFISSSNVVGGTGIGGGAGGCTIWGDGGVGGNATLPGGAPAAGVYGAGGGGGGQNAIGGLPAGGLIVIREMY